VEAAAAREGEDRVDDFGACRRHRCECGFEILGFQDDEGARQWFALGLEDAAVEPSIGEGLIAGAVVDKCPTKRLGQKALRRAESPGTTIKVKPSISNLLDSGSKACISSISSRECSLLSTITALGILQAD
jgi:hypothetical protein